MAQRVLTIFILLTLTISQAMSQTRACGTMEHLKHLEREKPDLRVQLQQQAKAAGIRSKGELRALGNVITIPVVVHVVYNTAEQNISEEQITSQIEVLNKDFRRLNADAANTPEPFKAVAADTEIEFKLAQRTPDGEPTNGITRTQTTVTEFRLDDAMKSTTSGGKAAWNTSQYLNIWIVKFSPKDEVLGYGQFPNSGLASTDGVVIDYRYFGTTGVVEKPFNLGRTTTHEVGHWLNLFHIWGDEECGDDQVADTPPQAAQNTGCPIFPKASCTNEGDMFMNYMDYTNDVCMNLFTVGQKNVMQQALTKFRPGILTSLGAMPVQVPDLDAALIEVTSPANVLCAPSFSPSLVLRNRGVQTLTSAQIQYSIDNGPAQSYTWTGSVASFQSTTLTIPNLTATPGAHTVAFTITSRNNTASDSNPANNIISASFQVQGTALPLQESFENATFPAAGWAIHNPDADLTWERTTKAAKTGTASAVMRNKDYTANGLVDELVLPALDLTSRNMPKLSFQVAYSLFSETKFSDTLEVWVSTDCGSSYQRIYQKAGQELTTTTPYFTTEEFVPTATQWRLETLDLANFASAKTALIKFRHVTDFENNLYLDDVKVDGTSLLGAEEERAQLALKVSPNPTTGLVSINSPEATISNIQVCTAVGNVLQVIPTPRHVRSQPLQLSLQTHANGIYLIRMQTDKGVVVRRVVLMQ